MKIRVLRNLPRRVAGTQSRHKLATWSTHSSDQTPAQPGQGSENECHLRLDRMRTMGQVPRAYHQDIPGLFQLANFEGNGRAVAPLHQRPMVYPTLHLL